MAGEEVSLQDALQVLRYIVGLNSVVTSAPFTGGCTVGYNAARSIVSRGDNPTLQDALQILRYIVNLPSTLTQPNPICLQCNRTNCICEGVLRVEIDSRSNVIRYFLDEPLAAGSDLNFTFTIQGDGIVIYDPDHSIMDSDNKRVRLFNGMMLIPMANDITTAFAGLIVDDVPAGAFIAIQEFEGDAESIVFGAHPDAPEYPIGNVILVS
jgi:hypothetical protein